MPSSPSILITGAAGGLGRAMVQRLLEEGYRVFATDIDETGLGALEPHVDLEVLRLDVTDRSSVQQALEAVQGATDSLAGLVNNAGLIAFGPVSEAPPEVFEQLVRVHVFGPNSVTQAFMPLLRKGRGKVINISSESVKFTGPFFPYAAAKCALEAWHETLRLELELLGLRAVLIRPGAHDTALLSVRAEIPAQSSFARELEALNRRIEAGTKHPAHPAAVAAVVCKALKADHPKALYEVNASAMLTLLSRLPRSWKSWVVRRMLEV